MRLPWLTSLILLAFGAAAFSDGPAPPSPEAETYLAHAIDLIRQNHINSAQADWLRIEDEARARIAGASEPADTYPAIRGVLEALRERHSFLVEPRPAGSDGSNGPGRDAVRPSAPMPTWQIVDGRFGVVRLPQLDTIGPAGDALGRAYAAALRNGLMQMDREPLCGWVVDLRENGGGNMWPMLRGLDPLLGNPPFGHFVLQGGHTQPWIRANGNIFPAPALVAGATPAFALAHQAAPVAVLIGPATASSGEMTAIALIGRPLARTFGAPSAGYTTANKVYPLPDGAFLALTETTVRDRDGRDYSGPIVPEDQVAAEGAEQAARRWLADQCS